MVGDAAASHGGSKSYQPERRRSLPKMVVFAAVCPSSVLLFSESASDEKPLAVRLTKQRTHACKLTVIIM